MNLKDIEHMKQSMTIGLEIPGGVVLGLRGIKCT
jgi:hypothetical protein